MPHPEAANAHPCCKHQHYRLASRTSKYSIIATGRSSSGYGSAGCCGGKGAARNSRKLCQAAAPHRQQPTTDPPCSLLSLHLDLRWQTRSASGEPRSSLTPGTSAAAAATFPVREVPTSSLTAGKTRVRCSTPRVWTPSGTRLNENEPSGSGKATRRRPPSSCSHTSTPASTPSGGERREAEECVRVRQQQQWQWWRRQQRWQRGTANAKPAAPCSPYSLTRQRHHLAGHREPLLRLLGAGQRRQQRQQQCQCPQHGAIGVGVCVGALPGKNIKPCGVFHAAVQQGSQHRSSFLHNHRGSNISGNDQTALEERDRRCRSTMRA